MPFVDNRGVRIRCEIEGAGRPLVLQHWSVSTLESWYDRGCVAALKGGCRLILLDGRGHGQSDRSRHAEAYTLSERVSDIVAVLDDLAIDRAHYMGYSMGGWIGFGCARYAPERFRSLVIGGQHPYSQSMDGLRQALRVAIERGPEAFVAEWEAGGPPLPAAERERMLGYDYEALLLVAQDRESNETVLRAMTMPCLYYAGDRDEVYPLTCQAAARMPNVTFVTLPGLDHIEVINRPDLVVPLVKSFLAKQEVVP